MAQIFISLIPIFLLILLGVLAVKFKLASGQQLVGLEKLTFYIFFPALLLQTLYKADFGAVSASLTALVFLLGILSMMVIGFITRKPISHILNLSGPSYSSIFQGFTRWNAFIALAVVNTFDSPLAITIVTIGIGAMVIPSNLVNIIVVARLGNSTISTPHLFKLVVLNPFILAVILGIVISFSGIILPTPIENTLDMLSKTALPIGLILVGTGLTFKMPRTAFWAAGYSSLMKLIFAPIVYLAIAHFMSVGKDEMLAIAVCAGVPSAMNGYLIAKELGGDAPLYAAIAMLQTVASMFTIPIIILMAPYLFAQ